MMEIFQTSKKSLLMYFQNAKCRDFPGGPVVKTPPCNAGLIPGQGTKISHVVGQLSLSATTREEKSMCCNKDPAQPKQILGREGDMAGMQ